jgi:hypothetical protein
MSLINVGLFDKKNEDVPEIAVFKGPMNNSQGYFNEKRNSHSMSNLFL